MKFEFKSLSVYEEDVMPNYTADGKLNYVVREFEDMAQAIKYVTDHHGFMTTDDGSRAFEVRNIQLVK
ncbi:MAG: hypothetical protein FWH31_08805 [Streptococcaceae bacterium]|uniref:Uncharacterized protein n=1 Tax=Lactococcus allomyrinae TaxID=2419773 RepID=A0A387BSB6_9LACT|nr:hypothetical protein [Lactococcus allomyrinae]AYG01361.1 hypothetical protein D7I46_09805 [Lactococcus allomyrinae]MCL2114036.1 hypothetical protein [Streptococcaceae bacterium]